MSKICVCSTRLLSSSYLLLLLGALSSPQLCYAAPAPGTSATGSAPAATTLQSDAAATQAMQNVLEQSGGAAAWRDLRSAEESFSVLNAGEKEATVFRLLDDWSLDTTRYRRGVKGQKRPPSNHNGSTTYSVNGGASQVAVPEYDQARALVSRLPAAVAEVMLRRSEYVLKISKLQACSSEYICIDVYRTWSSTLPTGPEQQWRISTATGLPATIRYQAITTRYTPRPVWREAYFLKYATQDGLIVPVSIGMVFEGRQQTWTFVSLQKNPGFDTAKFDQEVAQ